MLTIEGMFDEPELAAALDRLAQFSRVIAFDSRGSGASDARAGGRPAMAEESMADVVSVMDAAAAERAAVMKHDNVASAVLLASAHPEPVAGLILMNGYARLMRSDDYPFGIGERLWKQIWSYVTAGMLRLSTFWLRLGRRIPPSAGGS